MSLSVRKFVFYENGDMYAEDEDGDTLTFPQACNCIKAIKTPLTYSQPCEAKFTIEWETEAADIDARCVFNRSFPGSPVPFQVTPPGVYIDVRENGVLTKRLLCGHNHMHFYARAPGYGVAGFFEVLFHRGFKKDTSCVIEYGGIHPTWPQIDRTSDSFHVTESVLGTYELVNLTAPDLVEPTEKANEMICIIGDRVAGVTALESAQDVMMAILDTKVCENLAWLSTFMIKYDILKTPHFEAIHAIHCKMMGVPTMYKNVQDEQGNQGERGVDRL